MQGDFKSQSHELSKAKTTEKQLMKASDINLYSRLDM